LHDICKDVGQSNPGVRILEERFASGLVLLLYMGDERWLLIDKRVQQTSEHSRGTIDSRVRGFAEELGQLLCMVNGLFNSSMMPQRSILLLCRDRH
jgi:hypothetical protein